MKKNLSVHPIWGRYLLGIGTFVLAFAILTISFFRSSSIIRVFATPMPRTTLVLGGNVPDIIYQMPYAGRVLPDSPFWILKVVRDRIWFETTRSHLKKAELALLFSDKRLMSSKILFENKKPDIAVSTLTKGEKYLEIAENEEEIARESGMDTSRFLVKLALSALKHRQIIEENLMPLSPEDARPDIVKTEDYSKNAYKLSRDALNNLGIAPPENPFSGN